MKQNPCRHCILACDFEGKKYPSFKPECKTCEKIKKHREYLRSKRKFTEGEPITSLDELLAQEWVMWNGRTTHLKVILNQQMAFVMNLLKFRTLKKAIRKESEVN